MGISFTYSNKDLMELFYKEQELIERLTPYCNKTGKDIEFNYYLSPSNYWILILKTSDESRK